MSYHPLLFTYKLFKLLRAVVNELSATVVYLQAIKLLRTVANELLATVVYLQAIKTVKKSSK